MSTTQSDSYQYVQISTTYKQRKQLNHLFNIAFLNRGSLTRLEGLNQELSLHLHGGLYHHQGQWILLSLPLGIHKYNHLSIHLNLNKLISIFLKISSDVKQKLKSIYKDYEL
ncbi:hypothetical protein ABPG72_006012, partial [Tetrahymena utriculariae]